MGKPLMKLVDFRVIGNEEGCKVRRRTPLSVLDTVPAGFSLAKPRTDKYHFLHHQPFKGHSTLSDVSHPKAVPTAQAMTLSCGSSPSCRSDCDTDQTILLLICCHLSLGSFRLLRSC
jgi:hypothetical protein